MRNATDLTDVHIRIPLGMLNRHGLVAGATGTGKTKTLQLIAEQLSANGVPVFAADIKGDLSGMSVPGEGDEKIASRGRRRSGRTWTATAFPVEFYALGGQGTGVPLRVTMTAFGPILLSKVLGLNDTQESSLGLVFHYADPRPAAAARPRGPARGRLVPDQRRGQARAQGAGRALGRDRRRHPARADRLRGPGRRRVLRRAGVRVRRPAPGHARRPRPRLAARAARTCRTGRRSSRPS